MDEINDIGNVIANTIDNKGEDKRNFFGILRAQRGATDLYNISGDSLNLLNEAYKSNKIGADEYKEGLRNIIEATGNDLGLNVSLVYLDTSTMPKDSEGSTGSSYIVDRKNRKVLIPIDVNKIGDVKELLGTLTEEVAHGKDALEGRQDKKVAEDKSNDEEGLESLGRPANEYVKKRFGEDNNSKIKLTTDGIDLSNADVGEKVGDVLLKSEIDDAGGAKKVLHLETSEKITKIVGYRSNLEVFDKFLQGVTNKSLWSTIYDATPILGDIKGFHDGLTGKDSITGEKLSFFDRFIGGIPLIGRAVDTFQTVNKPMKKGMDSLINLIIDFSKGSSKIDNVNDTTKLVRITEGIGDSSGITKAVVKEIKVVDNSTDIAKTSKNVEKISDVSKNITDKVEIPKIKPVENIIGTKTGNKELNNVINTRGTEYYLDLRAQKATAPIDFDGHIINGEINTRGRAVGGHSMLGGNVRIDAYAAKNPISPNGIRNVVISVYDPSTGTWIQKVDRFGEPQLTTLFPENWSKSRIIVEVDIAYKNRTRSLLDPRKWEGRTPSGIKVEGYIAPNTTVYPLQ